MSEENDIENQNLNNNKNEKPILSELVPKDERLTAINSRDTKDSITRQEISEDNYEEKTCSMKEGSIQGGIFSLSSLALGTGAFSLPIRSTQIGLFWFLICVVLGSGAAYMTLVGLIRAGRKVKSEDYSPSVRKIIGKGPSIFIDLTIIIYIFGVLIQYEVIIYSLIGRTLFEFFPDDKYDNYDSYENEVWDSAKIKFPIMFGTAFLMLPLCFLKNISKMRFASMFGICALIYAILVVIIQTPWFFKDYLDKYDENDSKTHANWFNIKKGFNTQLDFFTGMATVFFCYTCHPGAFPVYKTLKKNNKDKINTVFFRSICLDIIIYILVTICGFMTAPTNPQELIIYRKSVFENDIFMTIAKIALAIDLFLCLPANYASYRCSFFMVFFKTDEIDNFRNCLVTIPTLLVSTLIGALYKDILDYISLFGGFCSTIICYMIPGVLMILTSNEKATSFKNILTFLVVACLATFGFMGGVQTLRKIITKK